jgi:mono/diheme cytochrome c family protein
MKLKVTGFIAVLILIIFIASCESEGSLEFKRYYSTGAVVYQTHCQNCHGANGEGLSALIPPLTDSSFLKSKKAELACAVKLGLEGQITVNGKEFNDKMPANDLTPIEIAQVLTYVTNSFGNKQGIINEQMVQEDLAKCK